MCQPQTSAAQRRAILANAHAKYFNSHRNTDAARALFSTLCVNNVVEDGYHLDEITLDSTTIVITIDNEHNREAIELDAYGNTIRGSV